MCIVWVVWLLFIFVERKWKYTISACYNKMLMERSQCREGGGDWKLHKTSTCTSDGSGNNATQSGNYICEIEWYPVTIPEPGWNQIRLQPGYNTTTWTTVIMKLKHGYGAFYANEWMGLFYSSWEQRAECPCRFRVEKNESAQQRNAVIMDVICAEKCT